MNYNEAIENVRAGHNLLFTFEHEAFEFVNKYKLAYNYIEEDLTDEKHIKIKGYNSRLYWIAK